MLEGYVLLQSVDDKTDKVIPLLSELFDVSELNTKEVLYLTNSVAMKSQEIKGTSSYKDVDDYAANAKLSENVQTRISLDKRGYIDIRFIFRESKLVLLMRLVNDVDMQFMLVDENKEVIERVAFKVGTSKIIEFASKLKKLCYSSTYIKDTDAYTIEFTKDEDRILCTAKNDKEIYAFSWSGELKVSKYSVKMLYQVGY